MYLNSIILLIFISQLNIPVWAPSPGLNSNLDKWANRAPGGNNVQPFTEKPSKEADSTFEQPIGPPRSFAAQRVVQLQAPSVVQMPNSFGQASSSQPSNLLTTPPIRVQTTTTLSRIAQTLAAENTATLTTVTARTLPPAVVTTTSETATFATVAPSTFAPIVAANPPRRPTSAETTTVATNPQITTFVTNPTRSLPPVVVNSIPTRRTPISFETTTFAPSRIFAPVLTANPPRRPLTLVETTTFAAIPPRTIQPVVATVIPPTITATLAENTTFVTNPTRNLPRVAADKTPAHTPPTSLETTTPILPRILTPFATTTTSTQKTPIWPEKTTYATVAPRTFASDVTTISPQTYPTSSETTISATVPTRILRPLAGILPQKLPTTTESATFTTSEYHTVASVSPKRLSPIVPTMIQPKMVSTTAETTTFATIPPKTLPSAVSATPPRTAQLVTTKRTTFATVAPGIFIPAMTTTTLPRSISTIGSPTWTTTETTTYATSTQIPTMLVASAATTNTLTTQNLAAATPTTSIVAQPQELRNTKSPEQLRKEVQKELPKDTKVPLEQTVEFKQQKEEEQRKDAETVRYEMLLKQRIAEMNLARQRLDEEARTVTAGRRNDVLLHTLQADLKRKADELQEAMSRLEQAKREAQEEARKTELLQIEWKKKVMDMEESERLHKEELTAISEAQAQQVELQRKAADVLAAKRRIEAKEQWEKHKEFGPIRIRNSEKEKVN